MANIFRRQPSNRLASRNLVRKSTTDASRQIAVSFFGTANYRDLPGSMASFAGTVIKRTGKTVSASLAAFVGGRPAMVVSWNRVGSTAAFAGGQALVFWIKNGKDGESHNINIRVETSRGQKLEGNLWISIVKEKPPPNLGA
jgi:hypothetical protein